MKTFLENSRVFIQFFWDEFLDEKTY